MIIPKTYLSVMRDTICLIVLAISFTGFMKAVAIIGTIWTVLNAFQKSKHDVEEFHGGNWKAYFKNFFRTKKK